MKLIVENPETNEKREIEVENLEQSQFKNLETLHYPSEMNPDQAVKRKLENLDISADQKALLWEKIKIYAQAVLRVGKQIIFIGRKIFDSILYVIKSFPQTAAGLAVGAVLSALIATIPVIGWLIGGLASVILPLVGGFIGLKEDIADKKFKRLIFEAINDNAVKKTIEQEVNMYEPLNTTARSMKIENGSNRVITQGNNAIKTVLVAQTELKFGNEAAEDLRSLLTTVDDLNTLLNVGRIVVECNSSNDFMQKANESLN